MPGCLLDPFQEYHRAQFENQHSRSRDPLYKEAETYKTGSCGDLSLGGCLVLLQQGSRSAGDNSLDTELCSESSGRGALLHTCRRDSLSGLSKKGNVPSSSPPPQCKAKEEAHSWRSQQGRGCPQGCCRPRERHGSPGLALVLCWVRLRTVWLEEGAGTPSPGLEAGPESQDVGLHRHRQGELHPVFGPRPSPGKR